MSDFFVFLQHFSQQLLGQVCEKKGGFFFFPSSKTFLTVSAKCPTHFIFTDICGLLPGAGQIW